MMQVTLKEWIEMLRTEQNEMIRRREQLLFDVASFVVLRAKRYARTNFIGRGPGATARTKGRSGALMRSIEMARVNSHWIIVTAGSSAVPYAGIHELGTKGKGGVLPSIVPVNAGALTIPLLAKYVGKRAREFNDLSLIISKKNGKAYLRNSSKQLAYLLLKRVDIPPRPYLEPAVNDIEKEDVLMNRIKLIFGKTKVPYSITRTWFKEK